MGPVCSEKSNKIGGYDKWEVQNDADKCIRVKEIEQGDQKYHKVVTEEVQRKAKAAVAAAEIKSKAAASIELEKKTRERMKKTFKTGSHNSHGKGGY